MTFRLPKFSLILAALACLVSALPAQREGGVQGELEARRRKLAQKRERSDVEAAELKGGAPGEKGPARMRRGSRGQCRFIAAVRPPKLLPGQTGTLLITAILQGRSVMPAPSQVAMTARSNANMVQLGGISARPAPVGTIHEAYRGQPVYENTAVFEVPVTITQAAKLGEKAQVAVDLEFDIFDGQTAQSVGRFVERVQTQVDIAPYADPEVEGRTPRAEPKVEAQPVQPLGAAAGAGGETVEPRIEGPAAMGGSAAAVDAPEQPGGPVDPAPTSGADDDLPLTASDEGGFPTMLIVGGGAFLLVIVLLLMRKK